MKKSFFLILCVCLFLFCSCSHQEKISFASHEEEPADKAEITPKNAPDYIYEQLLDTATMAGYFIDNSDRSYAPMGDSAFAEAVKTAVGDTSDWQNADFSKINEAPTKEVYFYNDNHHISFLPYEGTTYIEIVAEGNRYEFSSETLDIQPLISLIESKL